MNSLPESAVELRDALRTRELSATEAVEACLRRIAARPELGAFVAVAADQALRAAEAADARAGASTTAPLPRLHGVPLAHKDLVDVAGLPTTHGSAAVPHEPAREDSPGVAVLRAAGTISLGKTQVPEFGLTGYSENLVAPPARGPFDPSLTPGGSSGGSATAVATGILPLAPASDGGGSIRIPALACGLVGLKPGLGAVPSDLLHGSPRDEFGAPRLTVSGPLARDAADAAMLFDAMRGAESEPALAAVHEAERVSGLRIGISTASPFESAFETPLAPEARDAFEVAAGRLEDRGHHVEGAAIGYDARYPEAFTASWTSGLSLMDLEPAQEERLVPYTRAWRERALARPRSAHLEAAAALRAFAVDVREQWGRYDAVLTPGLATAPPRVGEFLALSPEDDYRLQCEWAPYTSMVNVSGLPAVAVPILRTAGGLSMGVQLIGRPGSEAMLLQLAAQLMG